MCTAVDPSRCQWHVVQIVRVGRRVTRKPLTFHKQYVQVPLAFDAREWMYHLTVHEAVLCAGVVVTCCSLHRTAGVYVRSRP